MPIPVAAWGSAPAPRVQQEVPIMLTQYVKQATARTPALVIYLLDRSSSMATPMTDGPLKGDDSRIEVVRGAIHKVLRRMFSRSTKGTRISPRYHMAMAAYYHEVQPLTSNGPE